MQQHHLPDALWTWTYKIHENTHTFWAPLNVTLATHFPTKTEFGVTLWPKSLISPWAVKSPCSIRCRTHTLLHTNGLIVFGSSALMSPPDSSLISSVVLLLKPVCVSVSLLCQSWVTHGNISLVRLTWQTKGTFSFFKSKLDDVTLIQ